MTVGKNLDVARTVQHQQNKSISNDLLLIYNTG